MNDRLKVLAEQQAGSILMDLLMPDSGMPKRIEWNIGCTTEHLEKFAELIVNDCVVVLNKRYMGDNNREDMEVRRCVEDVKKHFGVK